MITSEIEENGSGNCGSAMRTFNKQPPTTTKKMVLTDVQNDNRNMLRSPHESLPFAEGRPIAGTKRLTPEYPSSNPFLPPLSCNATADHLMYARKKSEYEQEKGRYQDNTNIYANYPHLRYFSNIQNEMPQNKSQMKDSNSNCVPVVTPSHMAPKMTFSYVSPSLPSSLGKPSNGLQAAEHDCLKATSEIPHFKNSKRVDDRQRNDSYVHLQNFLKECDESYRGDHIQMLLRLSPAELSRHAVELEKRSIQLTIEEAKEMQRRKALNILGKSAPTMNPLQKSKPPQYKS